MDVNIKSEPDILEDTISQSYEFLDEKPDNKNIGTIHESNMKINKKQAPGKNRRGVYMRKHLSKAKKMQKFTPYLKRKFLEIFQQEGSSPQTVATYAIAYNVKIEDVNSYFNAIAKDAQQVVYQECNSLSFSNITEWLNYFQTSGVSTQCNYEAATVMNAIANNEYHAEPEIMEGVNFKDIYTFLSNALMGLPQTPLDDASAKFLSNEFLNLINEANTDEADKDVGNMKRNIEYSLKFNKTNRRFYNLDPLNTHHKELERCCITNLNYNNLKLKNIITMLNK